MPAKADIPVIDMAAIANLIEQINYWQAQIKAMSNQLTQLKQTHDAMTGTRGMEGLLRTSPGERNYLPPSYGDLLRLVDGGAVTYAGLASQVKSAMAANAVLSETQMRSLSAESQGAIERSRQSSALLATLAREAYNNTSDRFAALQSLIDAIAASDDIKAIEELQGRVGAEQAMLTNEQTKLQALYQISQSENSNHQQRIREQVMAGHGNFADRFSPSPK
jgi:type IV secretion system protein VirB5